MNNFDNRYMEMAEVWAKNSKANRKKVGCLIVKDNQIISDGYNGTPTGFDNACEDTKGETKREVLHAESNAIAKIAKSNYSSINSTLYTTLSPCYACSKLIIQCQIKRVVYKETYRNSIGLILLRKANIEVIRL